jgi:tRNA 2-(methylsulfanyl)-N6-isopentenyladenosine37 hydroxylase
MPLQLQCQSSQQWVDAVLNDFNLFLLDHAANEKKASGVALNLAAHYPDKPELVAAMIDLAIEELNHYRDVFKIIRERHLTALPDEKDTYVNQLRALIRKGTEHYFLDRLLVAGIIEARGLERFTCVAVALPPGKLKRFYDAIAQSELRHAELFLSLANQYFASNVVAARAEDLLIRETEILEGLPVRAVLH